MTISITTEELEEMLKSQTDLARKAKETELKLADLQNVMKLIIKELENFDYEEAVIKSRQIIALVKELKVYPSEKQ